MNFAGAFVASTIFPVVLGLYQRKLTGTYAAAAMALGTLSGLIGYFAIGFYVAALLSCIVSAAICGLGLLTSRARFDWQQLNEKEEPTS